MIALNIDRTKIDRTRLKKEKYYDFVLFDNRHGRDEWGNDGFIAHSVSKEERAAGTKGAIVGNWKHLGEATPKPSAAPAPTRTPVTANQMDDDDLPF